MTIVLLAAPLALAACDGVRALVADLAPSPEAEQGAADLSRLVSTWDGVDVTDQRLPVVLERVAEGYGQVTDLQFPPGRSDVLVVLQKSGRATALDLGTGQARRVLSLEVQTASELGLLGLAFHPRWPEDRRVFVNYNPTLDAGIRTRISSFQVDPATWAATDEVVLLEVEQPYRNHDAGQLAFGPDGMLYVGLGDGGSADDPHGHGQNAATLLGSMLRLDVERQDPGKRYAVPPDNPFIGKAAPTPETAGPVPPETWAIGLRNPWRYSFHDDGRLVVADVGQNTWEEVNLVGAGDNLGWKVREGRHCFPPRVRACPDAGMVDPVWEYDHDVGQSITGGYTWRSPALPELVGRWLVADFVRGRIWALALPAAAGQPAEALSLGRFPLQIATFGRDGDGRVYVGDFASGGVYRITAAP